MLAGVPGLIDLPAHRPPLRAQPQGVDADRHHPDADAAHRPHARCHRGGPAAVPPGPERRNGRRRDAGRAARHPAAAARPRPASCRVERHLRRRRVPRSPSRCSRRCRAQPCRSRRRRNPAAGRRTDRGSRIHGSGFLGSRVDGTRITRITQIDQTRACQLGVAKLVRDTGIRHIQAWVDPGAHAGSGRRPHDASGTAPQVVHEI